ncbi:MAG: response regulator [Saprospiraceae bacterium]|nr:response regulator [Saprospiraceae bacterium]
MMVDKPLRILFIEDDTIERMKINRVLSKLDEDYDVTEVTDGEEALTYLRSARLLPDLIIMDLNMPRVNGIDFLQMLKSDDRMKYLPCVVLTTSSNPKDLQQCYELGIAGYLVKPLKYESYITTIEKLLAYWSLNRLVTRL